MYENFNLENHFKEKYLPVCDATGQFENTDHIFDFGNKI